jgi:hypothetical protein
MAKVKRTTFRPEVDGYAFTNSWTFDAQEKVVLEQIVRDALEVLEVALSPIIMAIAGPAIIAEAALCGPFAPICIGETIKAINDGIVSDITGAIEAEPYGLCGGMAFSSLDYWLKNWIVPRGNGRNDQPERSTPEGDTLRSYIWDRLIKSIEDNAGTFLKWMGALHIDGGAGWLRDHSVNQWVDLKLGIDSGQPVTLGLVGTTWNPLNNHQVLCYGYKDNGDGTGEMYLYDNNAPGVESVTTLDFNHTTLRAHEDAASSERGALRGFFCTVYGPKTPPVAVELSKGENAAFACVEQGKQVKVSFSAKNVGFHNSPPLELKIGASNGSVKGETTETAIAQGASRGVDAEFTFHAAQMANFTAAADLGTVAGIPMIKTLPPASSKEHVHTKVWVLPLLDITPYRPQFGGNECQPYNEAGVDERFTVDTTALGSGTFTFDWTVTPNLPHSGGNTAVFDVTLPDDTGASVELSVRVTSSGGCTTTGSLSFQTISQEQAAFEEVMCRIQHTKLYAHLYPWEILPDPATVVRSPDRSYIPTAEDLNGIRELAEKLVTAADTALKEPKAWTGLTAPSRASAGPATARVAATKESATTGVR